MARGLERALDRATPAAAAHGQTARQLEAVLMARDGTVIQATAGAHGLLLLMDGAGMTPDTVATPLAKLAAHLLVPLLRQLPAAADGSSTYPASRGPSRTWLNAYGRFDTHALSVWPQLPAHPESQPAPLALATLVRAEPVRVTLARTLCELPITLGQMQVCAAVHEGLAYGEIASRLRVARSTVVDHVRKACRTLDVGSAADLRWLFERRLQQSTAPMAGGVEVHSHMRASELA